MICDKCKNPVPDNLKFCPHCGAPVQSMGNQPVIQEPARPEKNNRRKGLTIFAGVLAVAAACFLGIALYIFINPGSGLKNGAAGDLANANENVTAQAAAGADVTAAGENDVGAGADTEAEVVADGEKAADDGSAPGEDVPTIPILQVENVHEDGDNGGCTMDYSRVSLGNGTETVFPELAGSLTAYSDEQVAGVREMYDDFLLPAADEIDRWLSVYMGLSLTRCKRQALFYIVR